MSDLRGPREGWTLSWSPSSMPCGPHSVFREFPEFWTLQASSILISIYLNRIIHLLRDQVPDSLGSLPGAPFVELNQRLPLPQTPGPCHFGDMGLETGILCLAHPGDGELTPSRGCFGGLGDCAVGASPLCWAQRNPESDGFKAGPQVRCGGQTLLDREGWGTPQSWKQVEIRTQIQTKGGSPVRLRQAGAPESRVRKLAQKQVTCPYVTQKAKPGSRVQSLGAPLPLPCPSALPMVTPDGPLTLTAWGERASTAGTLSPAPWGGASDQGRGLSTSRSLPVCA